MVAEKYGNNSIVKTFAAPPTAPIGYNTKNPLQQLWIYKDSFYLVKVPDLEPILINEDLVDKMGWNIGKLAERIPLNIAKLEKIPLTPHQLDDLLLKKGFILSPMVYEWSGKRGSWISRNTYYQGMIANVIRNIDPYNAKHLVTAMGYQYTTSR